MPKVVQMLKERREKGEGAFIDECWVRGVQRLEPGWFYAAEGPVSIGVPEPHVLADEGFAAMRRAFPDQAIVMLKERADGQA